jgi:hypothetical protein
LKSTEPCVERYVSLLHLPKQNTTTGGSNSRNVFSHLCEGWNPRSRSWQGCLLTISPFLGPHMAFRWLFLLPVDRVPPFVTSVNLNHLLTGPRCKYSCIGIRVSAYGLGGAEQKEKSALKLAKVKQCSTRGNFLLKAHTS